MELDLFQQSIESLNSLVAEYDTLESSVGRPHENVPRLKLC